MTIDELKSLLSRYGIRPNKALGQNFLLSESVLDQIVAAAELKPQDTVLEIGPGLGFLTRRLADLAGEIVAVEKDRKLCAVLRRTLRGYKNISIVCKDVLFYIQHSTFNIPKYKVVANIPYYLTGKILQTLLARPPLSSPPHEGEIERGSRSNVAEVFRPPSLIVLLLQKEVAERIVAKPGDMSILSVSVQFYSAPEIIAHVPKENFYPAPEVDSAIVRLKVLEQPRFAPSLSPSHQGRENKRISSPLVGEDRRGGLDEGRFFQLVKIGFSNKRKQLHNNLQNLPLPPGEGRNRNEISSPLMGEGRERVMMDYKRLLSSLGLDPLARAQDLSLEDWKRLYSKLFKF